MPNQINPNLDLVLERVVDAPVEAIWKAWTEPQHLIKWFCPRPYLVTKCEVDLRTGGIFRTDMKGPDMPESPCSGCILEVEKHKKFVWTSALGPGFRPQPVPENGPDLLFTGMILLEAQGNQTKYTALAIHADEKSCKRHEEMGFHEGWGVCLDQMIEEIKNGKIK